MDHRARGRWERGRVLSGLYAFAAEREWLGRPLARVLWRADVRSFYGDRRTLSRLPDDTAVLDVPCGGGVLFCGLGSGPAPLYAALDISARMLERAGRRARARGLTRVFLIQADAQALPLADSQFDVSFAHNSLHCYPDPPRALQELVRVLRPGGRLHGTAIVSGTGRWSDLVISVALQLGLFRSRLRVQDVSTWLSGCALVDVALQRSGAFVSFSGRRAP
ncbi:MAG: class I SAM-dependent methyltransferase [Candidatus Dormibacteraceae bacterium]